MKNCWLKLAVTALTLAALVYVGRRLLGDLHHIQNANWIGVAALVLVYLLTCVIDARVLQIAMTALRRPIRLTEGFSLTVLSRYSNLLIPRSGVGVTATYLKRYRGVGLTRYGSFVLFNGALLALSCSAVALLVAVIDWQIHGSFHTTLIGASAFLTLSGWAAIATRWRVPRWYRGPGVRLARRMSLVWKRLGHWPILIESLALHFVALSLRALRLYLAFWALGIQVNTVGVILASLLADLVFIVSFTPSALGLREATITCVAFKLGVSAGVVLSAALLDRIVLTLTTAVVAQFAIGLTLRSTRTRANRKPRPMQIDKPVRLETSKQ